MPPFGRATAKNVPLDTAIDTCLALFEAFRRLGIPSEAIFFATDVLHPDAGPGVGPGMVVRHHGREFIASAGSVAESSREQVARWLIRAKDWIDTDDATRDLIYDRGMLPINRVGLTLALVAKGFSVAAADLGMSRPAGAVVH